MAKRSRKVKKVILQAKEPLSLLETLKEEGMANAMLLMNLASGAAKNLKMENIKPMVKEAVKSLGFAKKAEFDKLQDRVEELEDRLTVLEEHHVHHHSDEE